MYKDNGIPSHKHFGSILHFLLHRILVVLPPYSFCSSSYMWWCYYEKKWENWLRFILIWSLYIGHGNKIVPEKFHSIYKSPQQISPSQLKCAWKAFSNFFPWNYIIILGLCVWIHKYIKILPTLTYSFPLLYFLSASWNLCYKQYYFAVKKMRYHIWRKLL